MEKKVLVYYFYIIFNVAQLAKTLKNKHPNVLLIVIDDLRPTLKCYGDNTAITPFIDEVANSGLIFTKAYAQQALCGPSRTSFLTSRRPDTTRLIDVHYYWRHHSGNFTTLPQYFKEHGYETMSAGKVFHPGIASNHNDDQPFSWSETPFHPSTQKFKDDPVCQSIDGEVHSNIYCPVLVDEQPGQTLPDIQTMEYVVKWLKNRAKKRVNKKPLNIFHNLKPHEVTEEKPFFLAVGFHKPHIPLKFPMEFLDLYPISTIGLAPNNRLPIGLPTTAYNPWNDLRKRDDIHALNASFPFGPIPDIYSRYIRQGYYAATSYTDSLVGLIVSTARSLYPDTIITVIGDHGWSLGEHQEWSKYSNYEVATRVPFIIALPTSQLFTSEKRFLPFADNLRSNMTVFKHYFRTYVQRYKCRHFECKNFKKPIQKKHNSVVELLDLFPTLVDLAGIPTLTSCSGYSSQINTCTEGLSLACIIKNMLLSPSLLNKSLLSPSGIHQFDTNNFCPRKLVALSQYPRPGLVPSIHPDSDQPRLTETTIMGYSLRSNRFRYTSWHPFNHTTFKVNWNTNYGEELYDHHFDDEENKNIVLFYPNKARRLRKYLKYYLSSKLAI